MKYIIFYPNKHLDARTIIEFIRFERNTADFYGYNIIPSHVKLIMDLQG